MLQLRQQGSDVDFLSDWLVWSPCCIKESQEYSQTLQFKSSILWHSPFLKVQISHLYMITGKIIALTLQTSVPNWVSGFQYTVQGFQRLVLSRSKCLLIFWLLSRSIVILEPKKIKSATVSTSPSSTCHEVMGLDDVNVEYFFGNSFLNVEF